MQLDFGEASELLERKGMRDGGDKVQGKATKFWEIGQSAQDEWI
jgi:hypothetical protein